MNGETSQRVHFSLYPHHLDFLDSIDSENRSRALQKVLDRSLSSSRQLRLKQIVDGVMLWICFGAVFYFVSYLFDPLQQLVSIIIGTVLIFYGAVGGMMVALHRADS